MLLANSVPLVQLAKEEGISQATLEMWRVKARAKAQILPDANAGPEGWSSRYKLSAVIDSASMNVADPRKSCRWRGGYSEPLGVWHEACERANDRESAATTRAVRETKDDKKRIKKRKPDLVRKK